MKLYHSEKMLFESRHGDTIVQVFEKGRRRELRFGNGIVQSAYSLGAPDTLLLEYTRAMMAGFLLCPNAEYALHIGLGGGCLPRFVHRYCPTVRQRVVEINPAVIEAAYKVFDLPVSSRLLVTEGEGARYLAGTRDTFDLIFVDAFTADGASRDVVLPDFHRSLRRHLNPGGWVINNVWGSDEKHLRMMTDFMAPEFACLLGVAVQSHSNVILMGGLVADTPKPSALKRRAVALSRSIPMDFAYWPKRLMSLSDPSSARRITFA